MGAWAGDGIRVNAIAPGFFWSDLTTPLASKEMTECREALMARVPLRRIAEPSEMAAPAVFLASDASGFLTGTALAVDGPPRGSCRGAGPRAQ